VILPIFYRDFNTSLIMISGLNRPLTMKVMSHISHIDHLSKRNDKVLRSS